MKTLFLILFLVLLPHTLNANQPLPEGDQHVATLAQELDDVVSASTLLKRCVNQDRSNAEAVNAANVLADNYDRLCAHFSQFYFWFKYWSKTSGKPSEFSIAAQGRLHDLSNRINTVAANTFQDIADALAKKPQYNLVLTAAVQRMMTSANTLEALKAQADGK
jgi:hypothetical protein